MNLNTLRTQNQSGSVYSMYILELMSLFFNVCTYMYFNLNLMLISSIVLTKFTISVFNFSHLPMDPIT
uniref:Uncharacterized protein n=1 Tax=Trichobilharzia regenti TaxID=157069 RepID=A0AA85J8J1_TRIRE